MNRAALRRIWGLVYRHLALYRRSWPRVLELMYWPVLQMVVWGFVTAFLAGVQNNTASLAAGMLLGGALLWEVALRSQMGFSISFLEEIWSRNLGHIFVSPLRPRELVAGLMAMSLIRVVVGVAPAVLLAWLFYAFGLFAMGPVVVAFLVALLLMGWAVALGVTSLLLRFGAGAETLAWSVLFGLTPFACVFYPVGVLPAWLQPVALALPAAHVFEGMRAALLQGSIAWGHLGTAFALDAAWLAAMALVFMRQFQTARVRGALLNIGE
ncbi:ABC transporter [Siccirubricoccus deserti]|uniref:Transport permease protein n=1 Tax=Siccirubricoccus deserti TaxID=2013562 RepID=A0A9X0QVE4_9PROT|nr:ABC transporter permease [Siccirubricoccus deserti]MBC4014160.1 ABC transporter permease [Siccirubricoccus deserti]GGC27008.1 ABC transporter [Siccirubricoccus deserti]